MQSCDLVVDHLAAFCTPISAAQVRVVADAVIAAHDGRIVAAGPREALLGTLAPTGACVEIDARGMSAIPGLVDCHTHGVFAGSRIDEFDRRAQGQTYEQIQAAGGGIRATVSAVREASLDGLVSLTTRRLARMRQLGTTTIELKSGYGLDAATEAKMLEAGRRAGAAAAVRVVGTVLALHALAPEAPDADTYVRTAIDEILPACAGLAEAADVFLERGAFSVEQCRPYLQAAKARGLRLRLHGDQFSECGAVALACELGAASVDHLEQTGPDGVAMLARHDVAAVCLPLCALYLGLPMPPARALLTAGARVAVATDFNPGSAPCESLLAAMNVACTRMGLSCGEALAAATITSASVLGRGSVVGRLEPGFAADVVLIDDRDWRAACYHLGEVPARVVAGGR